MKLPKTIPVFPLSNFIIFPKTTVPLNIFEPRYIDMVNDSMKADKFIGMVQPKITKNFDDNKLHIFLDKCQRDLITIDKLVEKTYF